MPTDFQKAKRRVKLANGNWSKPISYLTSSESVEMTDGSNLQTTINNKVDKVTDVWLRNRIGERLAGELYGIWGITFPYYTFSYDKMQEIDVIAPKPNEGDIFLSLYDGKKYTYTDNDWVLQETYELISASQEDIANAIESALHTVAKAVKIYDERGYSGTINDYFFGVPTEGGYGTPLLDQSTGKVYTGAPSDPTNPLSPFEWTYTGVTLTPLVETLETQVQKLQPSLIFMSRERRDITSDLGRLSTAVAEQNLAKYGYKIGDYFMGASGYTYILADYNTFKGTSTPYCLTQNHLGIVVDTHQTSQWYSGDASSVGYNGSVLNTFLKGTVLNTIKTDFKALFGGSTGLEHLIAHSKLFTTALTNWAWQANQYISALTCTQIDAGSQWTANGFQEGEASKSLELFRKYKWTEIFGGEYPWLRDLSNYGTGGSYACYADYTGHLSGAHSVSYSDFVVGLINFH